MTKGTIGRVGSSLFLAGTALAALPQVAQGQTITVTTTSMASVNDGICTLPEAVQAINNQASFQGCSFTPSGSADRIVLSQSGTFTTQSDMTANRTMEIDGNGTSSTILSTGGIWGFAARNGATLSISDMTIQKNPSQSLPVRCIYVQNSSLELDNVRIRDCNSSGINIEGALDVTLVDTVIENNSGAGIRTREATIEIFNSVIRGNSGSNGGGISNNVGATGSGHVFVYDTLIENNTATRGAGIYTGDSGSNVQVHLDRCLLRNNVSTSEGGGLYSRGQFTLRNTTVTGNRGTQGAGIYHNGAEFQIHHSTIVLNGGPGTTLAGGVHGTGGNRLFGHNIIANNSAGIAPDVSGSFLISLGYNLIENTNGSSGFGGTDIIGVDPMLGSLQSLGGPTMVFPLLAGSPAIDAIPALEGSDEVDQRNSPRETAVGTPRTGDDGAFRVGYDIGAFEQGTIESEFLTVAAKTSSVTHGLVANASYAKGEGTRLQSTADGHFVTYAIPVLSTGTYSFLIRARRGPNRGIFQVATSNSSGSGFTNEGPVQDLYAASETFADLQLNGATVNFTTTGTKYIRFTVTGKHASSTSRNLYLDWIYLVKN